MSRKARGIVVSFVVFIIVVAVLMTFRSTITKWIHGPTPAQVITELEKKTKKWQSAMDAAKQLVEQLRKDKEATIEKLRALDIKSDNDLAEKPKAQVLNKERITINARNWLCEKKIDSLDLAITEAELKKKNILRSQEEGKAQNSAPMRSPNC